MVITKEKFKKLWESGADVTWQDIADCAKAWGGIPKPKVRPMDEVLKRVLAAAGVKEKDISQHDTQHTSQLHTLHDTNVIDAAARAAHEANRAWSLLHGDNSHLPWENTHPDIQKFARSGVRGVLNGLSPEESHAEWVACKKAEGWTYGVDKDLVNKLHPCILPYADLPPKQRAKDVLFVLTVRAFLHTAGFQVPKTQDLIF